MSIFRKALHEAHVINVRDRILAENDAGQEHGTASGEYDQAANHTERAMKNATRAERNEAKRRILSGDTGTN